LFSASALCLSLTLVRTHYSPSVRSVCDSFLFFSPRASTTPRRNPRPSRRGCRSRFSSENVHHHHHRLVTMCMCVCVCGGERGTRELTVSVFDCVVAFSNVRSLSPPLHDLGVPNIFSKTGMSRQNDHRISTATSGGCLSRGVQLSGPTYRRLVFGFPTRNVPSDSNYTTNSSRATNRSSSPREPVVHTIVRAPGTFRFFRRSVSNHAAVFRGDRKITSERTILFHRNV